MNSDFLIRHATLRQLQIVVSVAYSQSYTRAAESLFLSQPTVSMQVQKLSNAIGMPLFDCVGKKIYLTVAGDKVLSAAEEILDRLSHLSDDIIELKGDVKGDLKISAVTNSKYFMPRFLGVFLNQYPDVKPFLKVTNRSRVLERLENNDDDLYIIGQTSKEKDLTVYEFLDNELVVVANAEHSLANKKSITLKRLVKERFLMREIGSGTRKAVDELMKKNLLNIVPYMDLGSSEAIKQAVMAGLGISILSLNNIQLEVETKQLVILDVEQFPLLKKWSIVHLKSKQLSLVARTFLNFMLDERESILTS